jgi:hydrogenase maturation protease
METNADNTGRTLVAGIGNIFLGDDAFGVEVVQRLARRPQSANVTVSDFGIRGFDLAYSLLEGFDPVILVDALPRGGQPGTLYVIEPELDHGTGSSDSGVLMQGHSLDPAQVLHLVKALGGHLPRLILVGCEPGLIEEGNDLEMSMSPAVSRTVDEAVAVIESLLERIAIGGNTNSVARVFNPSLA